MNRVLLVDGNAFFYRAYYGSQRIPGFYTHNNTSAVYTALRTLKKFLSQQNTYQRIFFAFDLGKNTFRHQQFNEYKINRKKTPDALIEQVPVFEEFLALMEFDILKNPFYEADDLIATLCLQALNKGFGVDILSNDGDLLQLVTDNVNIFVLKQGATKIQKIDNSNFFAEFAITPAQVIDFKALIGDVSDNLPGVKGVGPKTATKLLETYSSLNNLYDHLDQIDDPNLLAKLEKGKKDALFTQKMATTLKDAPLKIDFNAKEYDFNCPKAEKFYVKYRMKSLIKGYKQKSFKY